MGRVEYKETSWMSKPEMSAKTKFHSSIISSAITLHMPALTLKLCAL